MNIQKEKPVTNDLLQENLELQKIVSKQETIINKLNKQVSIEISLDKIRSRTMTMSKSEEIQVIVNLIFEELQSMKFQIDNVLLNVFRKDSDDYYIWIGTDKHLYEKMFHIPYFKHPALARLIDAKKTGSTMLCEIFTKQEKDSFHKHLFEHSDLKYMPEDRKQVVLNTPGYARTSAICKNSCLAVSNFSGVPLKKEENKTILKFATVFEQAYVRFLDLQKAENHVKEAQIEVALERVRARSLAMHKSNELLEVNSILFLEMQELGIKAEAIMIVVFPDDSKDFNLWVGTSGKTYAQRVRIPYIKHPIFDVVWEARDQGKTFMTNSFTRSEKDSFFEYAFEHSDLKHSPDERKKYIMESTGFTRSIAFSKNSAITFQNYDDVPYSDQENEILKRFATVLEQNYTRFLDLKKSEEQAREAQIEAALERVRTRSMAMHKTDEIQEVIYVVLEQIRILGISPDMASINIIKEGNYDINIWIAAPGQDYAQKFCLPYFNHPIFTRTKAAIDNAENFFTQNLAKKEKDNFFKYAFSLSDLKYISDERKANIFKGKGFARSVALSKNSAIILLNYQGIPFSDQENEILKRIAFVFEQSYIRFHDLEKAEMQAQESRIEASLERVRSQALAMQKSSDLINSITTLFNELEKLNFPVLRCGVAIGIFESDTREFFDCRMYTTTINHNNKKEIVTGILSFESHPMLVSTRLKWMNKESNSYKLEGKELVDYFKMVSKGGFKLPENIIKKAENMPAQFLYNSYFEAGAVYMFSDKPATGAEKQLFDRFADVFHMAYLRYEDLQHAEEIVRQAVKQASLDHVRSIIASMRSKDDLNNIIPLIWHELNNLKVPFIRCGVMIINEKERKIQTHVSSPKGKSLGIFDLSVDLTPIASRALAKWKENKIYTEHWDKLQFLQFIKSLLEAKQIKDPHSYIGSSQPPESLHLNFVPFKQGMLYVGNSVPIKKNELGLVQSLAEAFSMAYARYEDFKLLEKAKNKVEDTLSELKSAQKQLIHSEKMASLGELTAGIAHEIQNPLNFVNNFSEISSELLEEMEEKLNSGDIEEVKAITTDIKQNLDKINHHGKRASSIVKGMLEHTRTANPEKQLTDINNLADEYLRLSYHGLRAKDKSFNADFKTDFDASLPKLNIISQDIGRALLNLINNAFYAVIKKAKENIEGYKPIVTVITKSSTSPPAEGKSSEQGVEIRVTDNGSGIPSDLIDKIFQPFFTTKPTGAGTGLGLSLGYDIIKAHGGELKVESKEGEGSNFIIKIPINE